MTETALLGASLRSVALPMRYAFPNTSSGGRPATIASRLTIGSSCEPVKTLVVSRLAGCVPGATKIGTASQLSSGMLAVRMYHHATC